MLDGMSELRQPGPTASGAPSATPHLAEPDHLVALLGLYAGLREAELDESTPARQFLLGRARQTLLWEHLLTWLPAYTTAVVETGAAFYADWAALLAEVLAAEAATTGAPDLLAAHLRAVPPLPASAADRDDMDDDMDETWMVSPPSSARC